MNRLLSAILAVLGLSAMPGAATGHRRLPEPLVTPGQFNGSPDHLGLIVGDGWSPLARAPIAGPGQPPPVAPSTTGPSPTEGRAVTASSDARDPDLWPALTAAEQADAARVMRAEARRILDEAHLRARSVETDAFTVWSPEHGPDAERLADDLLELHDRLSEILGVAPGEAVFWGRAAVLVFDDEDRFRLVEAQSFDHPLPRGAAAWHHTDGPKVFIVLHRRQGEAGLSRAGARAAALGFLYRHRSRRCLPSWAREGLADHVASLVVDEDASAVRARRRRAIAAIRGGDAGALLSASDVGALWSVQAGVGRAASGLLVGLMIRERPGAFARWVEAAKRGKPWETALVEDFGTSARVLVERFRQYYAVND